MGIFCGWKFGPGNLEALNQYSSKIVFIDIISSTIFQPTVDSQLGEESFWDCLDFDENKE